MLCSRQIEKQYKLNLYKKAYIELLPLVNVYDLCLEKIVTCDFDQFGHFL